MRDISARELKGHNILADAQRSQQIKIKRHAHVVEGHILDFKPKKKRRRP